MGAKKKKKEKKAPKLRSSEASKPKPPPPPEPVEEVIAEAKPSKPSRRATAESMGAKQRDIAVSEFFINVSASSASPGYKAMPILAEM